MISRVNRNPLVRRLGKLTIPWLIAGMVSFSPNAPAMDIGAIRNALTQGQGPKADSATTPATVLPAAAPALTTSQDRLARATQAITAVRQMQQAARALAQSGANNLKPNLPAVPVNSFGLPNGLVVAKGVPTDLANPQANENASLWTGASLPTVTTQTTSGTTTSTVTIAQNQQQAVLNWDSFNIGKSTTLNFDQSAGGADIGQWIAFNKVGVTGNPSQILGSINAGGQVYVINPNGIIFGGSSQVNAHALVASSVPINDNLIARGLLNNPDSQFMFSALPQSAGVNGTPAFTPTITDNFSLGPAATSYTLARKLPSTGGTPVVSYATSAGATDTLDPTADFSVSATSGLTTLTFSTTGLQKLGGGLANVSYAPAPSQYGNVEVQPGAVLFSPTSADHVGGRIALVGPNVTNGGTLSAPDGQVILAAGLQVGFAAHPQNDPSLRGLDAYVGQVADPDDATYQAGTVTNAATADGSGNKTLGLIETADLAAKNADGTPALVDRPGAVTMAGATVNQLGVIDTLTTVAFNGRVDLLANYNASANPDYGKFDVSLTFVYTEAGPAGQPTGAVNLGPGSLVQIMPSDSTTDRVNRTPDQGLALPSVVNVQGNVIHFQSTVPAGETDADDSQIPIIRAPNAQVNVDAGTWVTLGQGGQQSASHFIFQNGQIYLDGGSQIDVAGTEAAPASVTENMVTAQLNGSELADSPLQRNGALRGKSVVFDLRVHGPWDPTLNGGAGGYTWVGTPLADVSGWASLVQRTAEELTTAGGTVNFHAGGSVVAQPGSLIDVSGGWTDFQGGTVQTTQLLAANGHVYDISQALPNLVYSGIYSATTTTTDPKWGITTTTANPLVPGTRDENSYIQGGNGGTVSITAGAVALDGDFNGQTQSGPYQTLLKPAAGNSSLVAIPSAFRLTVQSQVLDSQARETVDSAIHDYSPNPPNVTFSSGAQISPVAFDSTGAAPLPSSRQDEVALSPDLVNKNGFGFIAVDVSDDNFGTNGRSTSAAAFGHILLPVNSADPAQPLLVFSPASAVASFLNSQYSAGLAALTLSGADIDIEGGIFAPGGALKFTAVNVSPSRHELETGPFNGTPSLFPVTTPDSTRGEVTLGATARLNTAGQLLDLRAPGNSGTVLETDGGSVTIHGYQVILVAGSSIDVSGGAAFIGTGDAQYGGAGAVELKALDEESFDGAILNLPASYLSGSTGGAFRGYAGSGGGTFSLQAPLVQIGGTAPNSSVVEIDPGFFGQGGFANFNITGQADSHHPDIPALMIGTMNTAASSEAVTIAPQVTNLLANLVGADGVTVDTYIPTAAFAPAVSLNFNAAKDANFAEAGSVPLPGDLVFAPNASIALLPNAGSKVSLSGDTVALPGPGQPSGRSTISVPGGSVNILGGKDSSTIFGDVTEPLATVYLGPNIAISAAGAPLTYIDARGNVRGSVLAGGTINVTGNIVAEKGAVLDVSGSTSRIHLLPAQVSAQSQTDLNGALVPTTLGSNGGSISLSGGQMLFSDATLLAGAGGPGALGGSLSVDSGFFLIQGEFAPTAVPSLLMTAGGSALPVSFATQGQTAIGRPVRDADGNLVSTGVSQATGAAIFGGRIDTSTFAGGGFDWLSLPGSVEFSGAVSLRAGSGVSVGTNGAIVADTQVASSLTIAAPYVALGTKFSPPGNGVSTGFSGDASPTTGQATLTVTGASLVDIGNLTLRNIGLASLTTIPGGEIRGDGTFDIAGAMRLTAGQIYVPTQVTFNLAAYDQPSLAGDPATPGVIVINRTGTPSQVPLSAGGQLNVFATNVTQGGVLRAPLGSINLGGGSAFTDPITGQPFQDSLQLDLATGSVTSVSTVDLASGKPTTLPIPYGNNLNGTSWIDPSGNDITVGGPPVKKITVTAANVADGAGSTIDLAGGGDLYAYRWVTGTNGTQDILSASAKGFAVLPGYGVNYAPFAPFADSTAAQANLGKDPGYVSTASTLQVGDSVSLDLGNGQGLQTYTLLPARYALLPGAFLVTSVGGTTAGSVPQPDGSRIVPGYSFNQLDAARTPNPVYSAWEVAPTSVVRARAEYDDSSANTFFPKSAAANNVSPPRLPVDAGQLVLAAGLTMTIGGDVNAKQLTAPDGSALGRGGLVDIVSPQDILIAGPNIDLSGADDALVLDAAELSTFGAESLLIGGIRSNGPKGTVVTVTADNVIVDNGPTVDSSGNQAKPGAALSGSDIILAANRDVVLAPNAIVQQSGSLPGGADKLTITDLTTLQPGETVGFAAGGKPLAFPSGSGAGLLTASVDATITHADGSTQSAVAGTPFNLVANDTLTLAAGANPTITTDPAGRPVQMATGDGALVRVSSDPNAQIVRQNVTLSTLAPTGTLAASGAAYPLPGVLILSGAMVNGGSGGVILDATGSTVLEAPATGPAAHVAGSSLTFDSRGISTVFDDSAGTKDSLVLASAALQNLQTAGTKSLSLLSYTSIDVYGSGTLGGTGLQNLSLHAGQIDQQGAGDVVFQAANVQIDNSPGAAAQPGNSIAAGSFAVKAVGASGQAGLLQIGADSATQAFQFNGFNSVELDAGGGILLQGSNGIEVHGADATSQPVASLTINSPVLAAAAGAQQKISTDGVLNLAASAGGTGATPVGGLGATLALEASAITADNAISLPSGAITLHATQGDISLGGSLDVSGQAKAFNDVINYTSGGQINLQADRGAVTLAQEALLDVSAALNSARNDGSRLGDAGIIAVQATDPVTGQFVVDGILRGQGGFVSASDTGYTPGKGGSFSLDVSTVSLTGTVSSLQPLNDALNAGGFNLNRTIRVRSGDVLVDSAVTAHNFNLSADQGNITVTGKIDASGGQGGTLNGAGLPIDAFGNHGGSVALAASGSIRLASGAVIDASAGDFNDAGKGGSVTLSGGANVNGTIDSNAVVDLQQDSLIDLSVAGTAGIGKSTGTLHLRAPQNTAGDDLQINSIGGTIKNASSIVAEGYAVFQPADGTIDSAESAVQDNGAAFAGGLDSTGAMQAGHTSAITARLLGSNTGLAGVFHLQPGAEIINPTGDLSLGNTWDLSMDRFGPNASAAAPGGGEPGILTLRAAGNLVFNYTSYDARNKVLTAGSLNDGFGPASTATGGGIWQARLLPAGSLSWSYNLVAGADFSAADLLRVNSLADLPSDSGSVLVGNNSPLLKASPSPVNRTSIIPQYFQTIRTGTGDINIAAGRDIQLLNPLATIYTAGTQVADPTSILSSNDFDLPNTYYDRVPGAPNQFQNFSPAPTVFIPYDPQYSFNGGNVTLAAQNDILRQNSDGTAFSSAEMPTNWLYRRGSIASNGQFDIIKTKDSTPPGLGGVGTTTETASTTWWVDFSNFFEDVGALGGGNVSLQAGRNVTNVSAVAPTNARVTKQVTTANGVDLKAVDQQMVELGGGDVQVQTGGNIDGGVYYVERGTGILTAGGSIVTNATRTTLSGSVLSNFSNGAVPDSSTWLPTTLFLGKGSFEVGATGDITLGSVANPFLLPQGIDNSYYQRTYFSTFAPDDEVVVNSLQGDVNFKGVKGGNTDGSLPEWYNSILTFSNVHRTAATTSQPWLRLTEFATDAAGLNTNYQIPASLLPGTLKVSAFSGSINLNEDLTLAPTAYGTLDLLAARSVNGLLPSTLNDSSQPAGSSNTFLWSTATVNLSDANPDRLPGVLTPQGYTTPIGATFTQTPLDVLQNVDALFHESGATSGTNVVLQTELDLHGPQPGNPHVPLHGGDSQPIHLYAGSGDVSGILLFSAKSAEVAAGEDIANVGLYIQNVNSTDVSVVTAGRDILPYDLNSSSQLQELATSNPLLLAPPESGDIQISGPGTLQVLAGRNLNLGAAVPPVDGTFAGITSVGNVRNPFLPFAGANIFAAAGVAATGGIDRSELNLPGFVAAFLDPAQGGALAASDLPDLGRLMGFTIDDKDPQAMNSQIWSAFSSLPAPAQSQLTLDMFYLVLRNAGRDHNNPNSANFGGYNNGYQAIATLFSRKLDYTDGQGTGFIDQYLNPATTDGQSDQYLPVLGRLLETATGASNQQVWQAFGQLPTDQQHALALQVFARVLADASQKQQNATTAADGKAAANQALASLFDAQQWQGDILMNARVIETANGGDISILAPGGELSLGVEQASANQAPPGIVTAHGGNISIFTRQNVDVGVERIFTLRGGNEIIWSSVGNIAAGRSSKTVQTAPPTEVLVDPQSGNVKTDLAGLATGGGIGVLAAVSGVPPGDIDLVAPAGAVDAGDAGIRATGNLNIAAAVVLNASNIQVGGTSVGVPPPPPPPNLGALGAASSASAAASSAANDVAKQGPAQTQATVIPSIISVEVLSYGGGDGQDDESPGPSGDDDTKKNSFSP